MCPLLAIGWLEDGYHFIAGVVAASHIDRIEKLRIGTRAAFPGQAFRGLHECTLCPAESDQILKGSDINLLIPGERCVYATPGRIDHYIERHGYQPPLEFLEALGSCPDPQSTEYKHKLMLANQGLPIPGGS